MEGKPRGLSTLNIVRRRRRHRSQATLEFAFAAPLFLLCFLAAVDAGLWAVQNSSLVSGVENAARVAASAGASPLGSTSLDARQVTASIAGQLDRALFATRVVPWCDPNPHAPCSPPLPQSGTCGGAGCKFAACPSTPSEVEAVFGPRVVAVCVHEVHPPPCTTPPPGTASPYPPYCADSPTVTVRAMGFVAALVPPGFGIGASGGELPTDFIATTHTLRFAP
jgi:TadE-like protein